MRCRASLLFSSLVLVACGDDSGLASCVPGESVGCVGPLNCSGRQSCLSTGAAYSACECTMTPPFVDTSDSGVIPLIDGGVIIPPSDTGPVVLVDGGIVLPPRPDTGPFDAGALDPSCGDLGAQCTPDRGCARSAFCQPEIAFDLDSPDDPVTGLPVGADTTGVYFAGGYCTPDDISSGSLSVCNPSDPSDSTCGSCGTCVDFGVDTACLRNCTPSVTDRGVCRSGYTCDLSLDVCILGCNSDVECRIARTETNGIAGMQTPTTCETMPSACGGSSTNFDRLVYDTLSTAVCSSTTGRCEFAGVTGAQAGDPCTRDEMCERNGRCFDEAGFAWPDGYCTKLGCDVAGNSCAGDGECRDRRVGAPTCVETCTVASDAGTTPASWLTSRGGCRAEYACVWNGSDGAAVSGNGHCLPGNFNAVTTNNVGAPCTSDDQCWSPFGQGSCFLETTDHDFDGGYCTVLDCLSPGYAANLCGAGNACVDIDGPAGDITVCVDGCSSAEDCRAGYACAVLDSITGSSACLPGCADGSECRVSETCLIPPGATFGRCG